jgi:hypothetical protein
MEDQIQDFTTEFLGQYGWMFIAGMAFLLFKSSMESMVEGIKVFLGDDLNTDDVISIDGRPARVVRCGIWKTIFFVYDVECVDGKPVIKGGSKMALQNDTIKNYKIEKPLPMLDLSKWENCDQDDKE